MARAWIRGYRDAGGELDRIQPGDLAEFAAVMMGWFEFNVRRSLSDHTRGPEDVQAASDIVQRLFKSLPRYRRSIERWARVLGEE